MLPSLAIFGVVNRLTGHDGLSACMALCPSMCPHVDRWTSMEGFAASASLLSFPCLVEVLVQVTVLSPANRTVLLCVYWCLNVHLSISDITDVFSGQHFYYCALFLFICLLHFLFFAVGHNINWRVLW